MKIVKNPLKASSLLCILLVLFVGCDFSSKIHKRILGAQNLLKDQKYNEAVVVYKDILEKSPPPLIKFKVSFQLGEIYSLYLDDNKKAVSYYKSIIKDSTDPNWVVQAQEKLAEIEFTFFKNFKNSYALYKGLYDFVPKLENQDFYQVRLGISLLNLNRYEEAEKVFNNIKDKHGHKFRVRSYYFLGLIQFNKKNWKKATRFWLDYLKRETNEEDITQTKFLLANAYETMEELKKAFDIYYSILGEYPNSVVIKNRLKSIHTRRQARKR